MTSFDWEEYLEFAAEQVERRGNPAAERSAISRAYYAVFHRAKDYYVSRGEALSFRADDHGQIAKWFQTSLDADTRKIGADLGRLRQARRDADYEDRFPDLSSEARAAVLLAERLMLALANLV